MNIQNLRLGAIVLTVVFILLIPLIAMRFTDEVNWTLFDFVVGGALLLGTGLALEFIWRKVTKIEHRIAFGAAILLAFLLIWAELAVGVFGTPFAGS